MFLNKIIQCIKKLSCRPDRRTFPNMPIQLRSITDYDVKVAKSNHVPFIDAKIVNISVGGCKLTKNDMMILFTVDEPIIIQFNLFDFGIQEKENLEIAAVVRWTLPNSREFGCKFKEMDDATEEVFAKILKKLMPVA